MKWLSPSEILLNFYVVERTYLKTALHRSHLILSVYWISLAHLDVFLASAHSNWKFTIRFSFPYKFNVSFELYNFQRNANNKKESLANFCFCFPSKRSIEWSRRAHRSFMNIYTLTTHSCAASYLRSVDFASNGIERIRVTLFIYFMCDHRLQWCTVIYCVFQLKQMRTAKE